MWEAGNERFRAKRGLSALVLALALAVGSPGWAQQGLYIYPAKEQSAQQQEKDKYECNQWAVQQTGFNPMDAPTATAPPPPQQAPRGGTVRGGLRGAGAGAAIGAISGDAGKGAAYGALAGGVLGGARRREQVRDNAYAQQNYENQQAASYQQRRGQWEGAYKTCLTGRGYTVSS